MVAVQRIRPSADQGRQTLPLPVEAVEAFEAQLRAEAAEKAAARTAAVG
jgi:hypothetical protein